LLSSWIEANIALIWASPEVQQDSGYTTSRVSDFHAPKLAVESTKMSEESAMNYDSVDLDALNAALSKTCKGQLDHCEIDVGTNLDPFLPNCATNTVSLSFLQKLKVANGIDRIIPDAVYVRDCMRLIFNRFADDEASGVAGRIPRTLLVGSPGAGKSVLFFLAALFRARRHLTIYFRDTVADRGVSVFVMIPAKGNKVHVLFTRHLDRRLHHGRLDSLSLILEENLRIDRKMYFAFVDGLCHTEDPLSGTYDYLCTAHGFPGFAYGDLRSSRLWILDGWTKEEAAAALAMVGHGKKKAETIFWLCGGDVRDMLHACTPQRFNQVKTHKAYMLRCGGAVEMAAIPPFRFNQEDLLRTMFRVKGSDGERLMKPVHIVDSKHLVECSWKTLDVEAFRQAYELSRLLDDTAVQGLYFEFLIYHWFEKVKPLPIESIHWAKGKGLEGVSEIEHPNVYWIRNMECSPFVTSAVLVGEALCVVQVTIRDSLDFSFDEFMETFVGPVKKKLKFKSLVVFVLVPEHSSFDPASFLPNGIIRRLNKSSIFNTGSLVVKCCRSVVDTTSVDSFHASMRKLPFLTATDTA
jgi:hypothetical protein